MSTGKELAIGGSAKVIVFIDVWENGEYRNGEDNQVVDVYQGDDCIEIVGIEDGETEIYLSLSNVQDIKCEVQCSG